MQLEKHQSLRLCRTPPDRLVDGVGRPYFLWDVDMALDALSDRLHDADAEVRGYWIGKVMRQAKPDDAVALIGLDAMAEAWPHARMHLGRTRPFWTWLLQKTGRLSPSAE